MAHNVATSGVVQIEKKKKKKNKKKNHELCASNLYAVTLVPYL